MSGVLDALTEEECYLAALLQDRSGLDLAEFCWEAAENEDNCFRAWPMQWSWWRCDDPLQIDQCARSVGKSLGIKVRMFAHPFVNPGQEAVITAPELVHLEPVIQLIEQQIENTRLGREMMRKPPTHRPFMSEFVNGARLIGRIPQRDGKGVKGCVEDTTLILTSRGLVEAGSVAEGDQVWSHEGRWAEVVGVDTFEDEGYELCGQGSMPVVVNDRHNIYGRWNRHGPKQRKDLGPLGWVSVGALRDSKEAFHWVAPADFSVDQQLVLPMPLPTNGNSRKDLDLDNPSFWWLVGRWLADGYCGLQKTQSGNGRGRVFWAVHPNDQPEVVQHFDSLGWVCSIKTRPHSSADILEFSSTSLVHWLYENFGKLANGKRLHPGVLFLREEFRRSLLDGYISGDGTHTPNGRARWTVSSASRELIGGIGMLAHSLGFAVGYWSVVPKVTHICGVALKKPPQTSYRANISWRSGTAAWDKEGLVAYKVKSVTPVGRRRFVNIVSADHSYVANGILHHNTHPLLLEQDEGSDYPEAGWKELIETLKRGHEGAVWRCHGVTTGLRSSFYKNSQHGQDDPPLRYVSHKTDNKWTVHRIVAQARPSWSDSERQEKIQQYGSREDPDYRRNVIGAHGDSQSPLFVLHRLLRCCDDDPSTEYNTDEYWHFKIKDSELERSGHDILDVLDPPSIHQKYKTIWMGADIGFTIDPTEIMIAAECPLTAEEKADAKKRGKATPDASSRLKVIGRVTLQRIGEPQQADVIVALVDHYRPQVFAMDSTGVGLPLFQNVQKRMQDAADTLKSERAQRAAQAIKGYNFSSKILVEFDETVEVEEDADLEERIKESGIKRDILQHSTDVLRSYVDDGRLWLPWDPELIDEFRGQTYSFSKTKMDGYGRKRIFSNGSFHALDAMRMLALGHGLYSLEQLLSTKPPATEPVLDYFLDSNPFF